MAKKTSGQTKRAAAETPRAEAKPRKVVTLPPTTELPVLYINNVAVDISSWDVKFRLGRVEGLEGDTVTVKDVAIMYMSHLHARAFAIALIQSIQRMDALPAPVFVNPNVKPDEQAH